MKTILRLSVTTFICTLFCLVIPNHSQAQDVLENGSLEGGTTGWELYTPEDAMYAGCTFEVAKGEGHKSDQAGKMFSKDPARYCALQYPKGLTLTAGDRYRVTAWVKAGKDFKPQAGTPAYVLRVSMFSDDDSGAGNSNGFFFLGAKDKATKGDMTVLTGQEIPKNWEKMEGVFEITPKTVRVNVCIFVNSGSGSFFFDDVMLEKVPNNTSLSKLLGDPKK